MFVSPGMQHPQDEVVDEDSAYRCEVKALRTEMKQCTKQVECLYKEFDEIKKEIEAARPASFLTVMSLSSFR